MASNLPSVPKTLLRGASPGRGPSICGQGAAWTNTLMSKKVIGCGVKPVESIGMCRQHCPASICEKASMHANHACLVENALRRQFLGPWSFAGETQSTRSSDCCVRPEYLSGGACFPERGGSRRGVLHATVAAAITHDRLQNSVRHEIFWPMVRHCCGAHGPLLSLWLSAMSVCSSLLDCMCWQPACSTRFVCRPTAASVFFWASHYEDAPGSGQRNRSGISSAQGRAHSGRIRNGTHAARVEVAALRVPWGGRAWPQPRWVAFCEPGGRRQEAESATVGTRPKWQECRRAHSGRTRNGSRARARAGPH